MKFARTAIFSILCLCFSITGFSQQYQLNGNASANSCNCYTLTNPTTFQSGSAWNKTLFDLNNPFDFRFSVNLGCQDATGADGIVFMLQQVSSSLGGSGGGLGFLGVNPSIGVVLDTWQNTDHNDPVYDHISIQANGVLAHGTDLAGPVQASATNANIEDCNWHFFRISWDPGTRWLRAYFDGVLRVQAQVDLIGTIFKNNPMVYWGFSAATGGNVNLQQFCTALTPSFSTDFTNNATCIGTPVDFHNTSESFAPITAYYWNFGDGFTYQAADPPPHLYANPGLYTVKLAVKGFDGCDSDTLQKVIAIGDYPIASFDVYDTCAGKFPRIVDRSAVSVGTISKWEWTLNGVPVSTAQNPQLGGLLPGPYTLRLQVTSNNGCASAVAAEKTFTIRPTPVISMQTIDGCVNQPHGFTGSQVDNATTITSWNWQFGDGISSTGQSSVSHTYTAPFYDSVRVTATASNGCVSVNAVQRVFINKVTVDASGSDTIAIRNQPFNLQASAVFQVSPGGAPVTYQWNPPQTLNNPAIASPQGIIEDDEVYTVTVTTPEGCTATDIAKVTFFKGSTIFVPTGFTPNGDGLNDWLRPYYVGIKEVSYFMVYNRWGQTLFSTKSASAQWDGTFNGKKQPNGVYIWRVGAVDYAGKVYELQGTTTIVR